VCAYTERGLFQNSFFELLLRAHFENEAKRNDTYFSIFASEAAGGGSFHLFLIFFGRIFFFFLPFFHRAPYYSPPVSPHLFTRRKRRNGQRETRDALKTVEEEELKKSQKKN